MTDDEQEVIDLIQKQPTLKTGEKDHDDIDILLALLKISAKPVGSSSIDFIRDLNVENFIMKIQGLIHQDKEEQLLLWLRLEQYLDSKSLNQNTETQFQLVEDVLTQCLSHYTENEKAAGVTMLPSYIANPRFIQEIFSLDDEKLTSLFLDKLPRPPAETFQGKPLPDALKKYIESSENSARDFLGKRKDDNGLAEKSVIKIQRLFRAKLRKREDIQRVSDRFNLPKKEAEALLLDASTPYKPKCDTALSERLYELSEDVVLFSEVKHLSSPTAIKSIFNNGLYGRKTLMNFHLPFKEAALSKGDIEEGDANVVCLGANEISPLGRHGVELTFDAEKIADKNPCAFYKQRDLHHNVKRVREIKIGDFDLQFNHTGPLKKSYSPFILYDKKGREMATTTIKSSFLVAYNMKDMHQILTLNFFRFIDGLEDEKYKLDVYEALSKLDDKELEKTLQDIGKKMTDTMEFNFYGAYLIDFPALINIKKDNPTFELDLQDFIEQLNSGDMQSLEQAMENLPEAFGSYRFLDYLLSMSTHEDVIERLNEARDYAVVPSFRR